MICLGAELAFVGLAGFVAGFLTATYLATKALFLNGVRITATGVEVTPPKGSHR